MIYLRDAEMSIRLYLKISLSISTVNISMLIMMISTTILSTEMLIITMRTV